MTQICVAWAGVCDALREAQPRPEPSRRQLDAVDAALEAGGAAALVQEVLRLADTAASHHVERFWVAMGHADATETAEDRGLDVALQDLSSSVDAVRAFLNSIQQHVLRSTQLTPHDRATWIGLSHTYSRRVAALVLATGGLPQLIHTYLAAQLEQMSEAAHADADAFEGNVAKSAAGIQTVARSLCTLGLEVLLQETCSSVVCHHLREQLFHSASGSFDESILDRALECSSTVPLHFLSMVLPCPPTGAPALQEWRARLSYFVYEVVGSKRIADLFDIVVDYPDSLPAVHDLRVCLGNTNLHGKLIGVFGNAIQARLLHPGAATTDIIQQYVSTIKALQHVDPSGLILDVVGDHIRKYLRSRKDTIRCIVTMLTDDGEDAAATSLLAELGAAEAGIEDADGNFESADADEQALQEAECWEPDPVEADVLRCSTAQQAGDVLSMLVGIYGSREVFINEYRSMLAERLLAKTDYDCDRELRTLELLKVRFGECNLHNAEIMLKDLADSKRVNANVKSVPDSATPVKRRPNLVGIQHVDATIISELFWPQLPQEDFALPQQMRAMLDTYGAKFQSLKAPRKLDWKASLGTVELEVFIGGQELYFSVSPLHASMLMHFQQRQTWSAVELGIALKLSPDILRKKIVYWINQGILSESKSGNEVIFHRNEELMTNTVFAGEGDMDTEGHSQQEDQQMAKLEPFIMGMLTNFDALPLDRIHNMLKMFVSDPPYDKTMEQLGTFLNALVAAEKLSVSGGLYRKC